MKRSYPACPCASTLNPPAIGAWSDLFLYTNGICYGQWVDGPYSYVTAQSICMSNAGSANIGRAATFPSGLDYNNIAAAITGHLPGPGSQGIWIGLNNQKWDDPNTPSCPPPLNVTEFESVTGVTIPSSGYAGINSWTTWVNPSTSYDSHLCEIGKLCLH